MSRSRAVIAVVVSCVGAGLLLVPGCVGDAPAGSDAAADGSPTTGKYKGPCFPNDTCDKGLVCVQGAVCLMPGEEAGPPDAASEAGGEAGSDAAMCKNPGDTCMQADCCNGSTICLGAGGTTRCCQKGPGSSMCSTANECCDYMGKQMMCVMNFGCCVAQGNSCMSASDCCDPNSHGCVGMRCCLFTGKTCSQNGECCNGVCSGTCN